MKFLKKLSIGLLTVVGLSAIADDTNWPTPSFPDCSFYSKVEEVIKCKEHGSDYLISYGAFYCEQFSAKSKVWAGKLKEWTLNTGQCLQEMLFDNRSKRLSPCEQMEEFAFDVHPICYKQYRICELSYADRIRVFNVVRWIDMVTRHSLVQLDNVVFACISDSISGEESASYQRLRDGTSDAELDTKKLAQQIIEEAPIEPDPRRKYFKLALSLLMFKSQESPAIELSQDYAELMAKTPANQSQWKLKHLEKCLAMSQAGKPADKICDPSWTQRLNVLKKTDPSASLQETLNETSLRAVLKQLQNRPPK
jgi:hypothetical protein